MKQRKLIIIYTLIFILLLLEGAVYYYRIQEKVTADKDCGKFDTLEEKDACCVDLHKNDAHILCVGDWVFTEDKECSYRCGGRKFAEPPELDERENCEALGGTWKEFPNGCVDSCEKARNPSGVFCTQAFTFGCDCGIDKCWNGEICENN